MPNVQFFMSAADFVDFFQAGEVLGLSEGRLAKALAICYMRGIEPTPETLIRVAGTGLKPRNLRSDKPREMV